MARLEELTQSAAARGLLPPGLATIVGTKWEGTGSLELTYKDTIGAETTSTKA